MDMRLSVVEKSIPKIALLSKRRPIKTSWNTSPQLPQLDTVNKGVVLYSNPNVVQFVTALWSNFVPHSKPSPLINHPAMTTVATPSATDAACITVTPDTNGYVPLEDCRNLWSYYPSFGAAIL